MRKKLIVGTSVAVAAAIAVTFLALRGREVAGNPTSTHGIVAPAEAGEAPPRGEIGTTGKGMAAIEHAAKAGKYLFVFFYRADTGETDAMRKVFRAAMAKASDRAEWVEANVADPSEEPLVRKFNVSRAPMPLALAVAPNGAIAGGFPAKFDENALLGAFVSPGMEKCLKALQEQKLVILCAQNTSTESNDAATKSAQDFKADARFAQFTVIVRIDPADAAEGKFMARLRIEPKTAEAITALLAPPGVVVGTFKGGVAKDALVSAFVAATSGGCGSGGCGPSGCN